MKPFTSTIATAIFILLIIACGANKNKHQQLLNWLDSNNYNFSSEEGISDDSAMILILSAFADSDEDTSWEKDLLTSRINLETAIKFCDTFETARRTAVNICGSTLPEAIKLDHTLAILVNCSAFVKAFKSAFKLRGFELANLSNWEDKSFLVYPANYGDISGTRRYQSTAIIQFAEFDSEPNNWKVLPEQLYDFGDLKPPHIAISNPDSAPN